ncbi:MAG: hypothetical protein GY834_02295 [Bacteroidetes bacterium]|nr:hypothetical protein [Bacteroidota bacterium]
MKENTVDEILSRKHASYDEYERDQFIIGLDVGDVVKISVYDVSEKKLIEKKFIAKYGNSHINCQWQDKGVKKLEEVRK